MGVVHEPVEDAVGQCGIADLFVRLRGGPPNNAASSRSSSHSGSRRPWDLGSLSSLQVLVCSAEARLENHLLMLDFPKARLGSLGFGVCGSFAKCALASTFRLPLDPVPHNVFPV